MAIYRLIYKSKATVQVDLDVIMSIARQSQRRNEKLGITGILLATTSHFFQVLEGEQEPLNWVYSRIMQDPRHRKLVLVSYGLVPQRRYEGWAMKGVGLMSYPDDLSRRLLAKYGAEDGGVRFPLDEPQAQALLFDVDSASTGD